VSTHELRDGEVRQPHDRRQRGERRDREVSTAKGERESREHGAAREHARAADQNAFVVARVIGRVQRGRGPQEERAQERDR
jgi:hypothetical protein